MGKISEDQNILLIHARMARSHKVTKPKRQQVDTSGSYNALMVLMGDNVKKAEKRVEEEEPVEQELEEDDIEGAGEEEEEVDEEQEEEEDADDAEEDAEDDSETDKYDPYKLHFEAEEAKYVSVIKSEEWKTSSEKTKIGSQPVRITYTNLEDADELLDFSEAQKTEFSKYTVRPRIKDGFKQLNGSLTSVQKAIYPSLMAYRDLCYATSSLSDTEEFSRLVAMHIAQHVVRTAEEVAYNTRILKRNAEEGIHDVEFRDQGYTKPRVLVLVPTKNACFEFMQLLVGASGVDREDNKARFNKAFHEAGAVLDTKPEDFQKAFKGNTDDMFCLGVKLRNKSIRYYSYFYQADIVFASPLGLKTLVGSEGDSKREFDFLSSIEIAYLHETNHMEMQSWDNVLTVLGQTNLLPNESHGCDFSRVKSFYLDGLAKHFRQTIVACQFVTPTINSVFSNTVNFAGKTKITPIYNGELAVAGMKIRQIFTRFKALSVSDEIDARFKAFVQITLEGMIRSGDYSGTLIYVPTYVELVRLRNYMDEKNISFGAISEYSSITEVKRHRTLFRDGREKILLYTGRLHHYRRYFVKGVKSVVIYKLPENPAFYRELLLFLTHSVDEGTLEQSMAKCRALFTIYDLLALERIVGTKRVKTMAKSGESSYEFY